MGLSYADIDLSYVLTESVNQTPETDPTGLDVIGTRVLIRVRSVVSPPLFAGNPEAGDMVATLRAALSTPRQRLTYSAGSGTVLEVNPAVLPAGTPRDAETGPMPKVLSIVQVSPAAIIVDFAVSCLVRECAAGRLSPYSSLKWEDRAHTDMNWVTTRTRTGLLITPNGAPNHPDDLRLLVTPTVPAGFRRESADYTLDPSGLRLKFSFVDKEVHKNPPYPATRLRGEQVVGINRQNQMRHGEISLVLEGPRISEPQRLLAAACRIAFYRMEMSDPLSLKNGQYLVGGMVGESLDDDRTSVTLKLNWIVRPTKNRAGGNAGAGALGPINPLLPLGVGLGLAAGEAAQQLFGAGDQQLGGVLSGVDELIARAQAQNRAGQSTAALSGDFRWVGSGVPGSNPLRGTAPPMRGTAPWVKLYAAALSDPCGTNVGSAAAPVYARQPAGADGLTATAVGSATLTAAVAPVAQTIGDTLGVAFDDSTPGVYTTYKCQIHYTRGGGNAVLPTSDPDGTCVEVRFSCPTMTCRVEWVAERMDEPPEVPRPESRDPNMVFLRGTTTLPDVIVGPDGVTPVWAAAGVYDYGVLDPAAVKMKSPTPPWMEDSFGDRKGQLVWADLGASPLDPPALPADQFVSIGGTLITNPFSAPPAGGGSGAGGVNA